MRTIARAAAWLLPLAAAACLTDPAAPVELDAPTALRVVTQTSPSDGDRTVQVEVYFLNRDEARVDLPVSPAEIVVPANSSVERTVTAQLATCFAEGFAGEGGVFCPLHVRLVLLDDAGETLAEGSAFTEVLQGENPVTIEGISLIGASISGVVVDARTGDGIGGANVALYTGTDIEAEPAATLVAGTGGAYLFPNVSPGTYTLVATSTGFFRATVGPITVERGVSTTQDIVASPELAEGETSIVLTWGETPSDLDSYLFGPPSANNYHVFYERQTASPYANLDLDDLTSFGPETITITQQASGRHVYAVHNFSDRSSTPEDGNPTAQMALANSGARVQVFRGDGLVADFRVPTGQAGTLWTVFSLDGDVITPINTMTFVVDPDLSPPAGAASVARGGGATLSRTRPSKRDGAPFR